MTNNYFIVLTLSNHGSLHWYAHYSPSTALLCPWRTRIASDLHREERNTKNPTEVHEE